MTSQYMFLEVSNLPVIKFIFSTDKVGLFHVV
jgi:hypothetical protein